MNTSLSSNELNFLKLDLADYRDRSDGRRLAGTKSSHRRFARRGKYNYLPANLKSAKDEELSDLQRLGPEGILLRWFNFHLRNDKSYEGLPPVTNFKKDLAGNEISYGQLSSYCKILWRIFTC